MRIHQIEEVAILQANHNGYDPENGTRGMRDIDDEKQINKQDGIVNKTFVEMLDKLGYDIQITYVKKEEAK